ncbi:class I SAM-dependent methyltransferase, partial [bacterium]|nr:class I SAM-dependent methyltransferase [bacterium]MBU1025724.1 class I SAM-dependent methyltransferase [bacterium]
MTKELSTKEIRDLILTVVAYADLFDYPLTIAEIQRDIPENNIPQSRLEEILITNNRLTSILKNQNGMFCLKNRDHLVKLRRQNNHNTELLFEEHRGKIDTICRLPWVRAVALTGSVAFNNAQRDDDIDLFVIVKANRLWLVDLYNLFAIRIWREKILGKSKSVCVNYIVDEAAIALKERDYFSSHQVVHMIPVYDEGVWKDFVDSNKWAFDFFPAATVSTVRISKPPRAKKKSERFFDFLGAGLLNTLIYSLRARRLRKLRHNGVIKGEYEFRRLKANDSRFGSIVQKRLIDKILETLNQHFKLKGLLDKSKIILDENGITECISPETGLSIEPFLKYYTSKIPENEKISNKEILELPFQKKERGRNDVWRIRERNFNLVMGLIRELEPDGNGPVLDSGAGNCWLSRRLIETGYDTVSLDPLKSGEIGLRGDDIFEREIGIKLTRIQSTMEVTPFRNSVFNGVVSSGSFHYTNSSSTTLKEIHRILKPDGWAIIYDSPVFGDSESGNEMIEEKKLEFGDDGVLDALSYQPIWFIVLDDFL